MERTIFFGVGAAITRIDGKNQCQVAAVLDVSQPVDLADQMRWIPVDLDRTPSKAALWKDVTFDDRGVRWNPTTGTLVPLPTVSAPKDLKGIGITSIGPIGDLPNAQYFGAVYFSEKEFTAQASKIQDPTGAFTWCPTGWFEYELQSIAYSKDLANGKRAGERYVGFHARVDTMSGAFATVSLLAPITRKETGQFTLDLSDPADSDDTAPITGAGRLIVPGDAPTTEGAIFVNLRRAARSLMREPKLPVGMGM